MTVTTSSLQRLLCQLGMTLYDSLPPGPLSQCYTVMLDGRMIGWLHDSIVTSVAEQLRTLKVQGLEGVSVLLSCHVLSGSYLKSYPNL